MPKPNEKTSPRLIFKAHEGTYLVGAIAALKTETNRIGFIGGMNVPLLHAFEAGYYAGAKGYQSGNRSPH